MKRDGRTLDHATLETIRLMAVERVLEGEVASAVITSYGFNRTTIYKWLTAAAKPGVRLRALHARPAPGRPRRRTPGQEQQVFRWINGKDPRQYGLDFGLWTRSVVADLIARKFGITLGLTAVGDLLAKLNLTPQKPLQRAYQRDPEAIERWRRETYPTIAQQAKAEGGEVFFWDESGFRADAVHGRTWGVKGQTPVVDRPGQRQSISAASVVKAYVLSAKGRLTLHFLPGYAPELNPDELVWSYVKRTGVARTPLHKGERLKDKIEAQLASIKNAPRLVRSFFRAPTVAYITDW